MAPSLDQLAAANGDKVAIIKVDVDKHAEYFKSVEGSAIPDVRFYLNGEMVDSFKGGKSLEAMQKMIDKHTKKISDDLEVIEEEVFVSVIRRTSKDEIPAGVRRVKIPEDEQTIKERVTEDEQRPY